MVRSYRDLVVWQQAMELAVECYRLANALPDTEKYGLSSQIRRAVVSIPANIAEGHARKYTREFVRHLSIAAGSLAELETHLMIATRLHMIPKPTEQQILRKASRLGRMLTGLRSSLHQIGARPQPPDPSP